MWSQLPVAHLLLNSVIIAGGSTILALLTGIPAAFALSRMNIVGRKIWLFGFLATQLFSPSIIIVSAYHVMAIAHLTDTYWGLIILDAGFYSLPFVLWSIAGFMRHIPRELEETVDVDGGTTWTKIWRVFVPIAIPSIVVAGVYAFIQSWNDFAFALTLATSQSTMPLPIGIYSFMGAYQIQWNYLMGASLVATLPVLILFLIVQKRLVSGMLAGSIK
jgi:multiple sugar transport system permease protein